MNIQDTYQTTILFAATKHQQNNQTIPGTNLPYLLHLSNVAMEILMAGQDTPDFDTRFAVQVALLHDVLEDTDTTFDELSNTFGQHVAEAVQALSKNKSIPKEDRLYDSLQRITQQPKEVWSVKLADRITNLQKPPSFWTPQKISAYHQEAILIQNTLKGANYYLETRLKEKIEEYGRY